MINHKHFQNFSNDKFNLVFLVSHIMVIKNCRTMQRTTEQGKGRFLSIRRFLIIFSGEEPRQPISVRVRTALTVAGFPAWM